MDHRWTWSHTAISIVLLLALTGWLIVGEWGTWFAGDREAPLRPATINNVVLRIDSNIIRIQIAMENLVFSEDPAELADNVKSVDQLVAVVDNDFKAMGEHFSTGNAQYQKALALFREWKNIRDEVIRLTAAGSSPRAEEIVRGECAAHAQEIREALMALNTLSKKRREDFDSDAFDASREKRRNQ